ncbi:hypothetical protein EYB26_006344 [Talaromyces marneffei]|nr:uncharacterized protein EYB26_006344 [Talaromyces marneffei]QGA18659.1 hypothetical protein EYB26_006344 [Talaromyces marneffei]
MAGSHDRDEVYQGEQMLPPGTFLLIREDERDETHGRREVVLDPVPSSDPNEPLNWSTARKAVNYTLVLAVSCVIFTAVTIQTIFWQMMVVDLNVTYTQLNNALSLNFVGLAMGCVFFIPLAKKFGRRPVYLVSTALIVVTTFWSSEMQTLGELYGSNLIQGLAGATNECIVQMTISDLFFVHHRGTMNTLYMCMVMIGSFLSPIAAGTQATNMGWRSSYRTLGIFTTIILVLFCFLYEETKYGKVIEGLSSSDSVEERHTVVNNLKSEQKIEARDDEPTRPSMGMNTNHQVDATIPMRSWKQRLAFHTYTPESIWPYFYRPFVVLSTFPTVIFCAVQYAFSVAFLTIIITVTSLVFPNPPYNFTSQQVGFMGLGPFVGNLLGAIYGGIFGDWSILYFSRRNKGYYEPEMRLYTLHLPALFMSGGLIMFGVTLDRGMHWIYPSIGGAFFGFGLGCIGDVSLTLVIDSYRNLTGDAFTGVAFLRNVISIGVPFGITPWISNSGLQNMFIECGFISLLVLSLTILIILYGKRSRARLAPQYAAMSKWKSN